LPVREVLRYPHPALKRASAALSPGAEADGMVADLVATMRSHPGCVGLAAPQLGDEVRLVAVDVSEHPKAETSNGLLVLLNPVITAATGSEVAREGCLSIPELTANVRRATQVTVQALAPDGSDIEISSLGFEARCLQHELDHLDGILFLDRVDSIATDVFPRKVRTPRPPS
jgi:peptide deformylase